MDGMAEKLGEAMIVHMLYHMREREDGRDNEKLIGIYGTKKNAEAAIKRAAKLPGFRDFPDGFEIFERTLDEDSWREGFITADDASS